MNKTGQKFIYSVCHGDIDLVDHVDWTSSQILSMVADKGTLLKSDLLGVKLDAESSYCATSIDHMYHQSSVSVLACCMLTETDLLLRFVFSLMLPQSATVRLTPVTSDFLFSTTRLPCLCVNV